MTKELKKNFIKSIIILGIIHLAYFIYGYFQFEGIKNVDVYTEFYRFKFYDDVSISHFLISSLFLMLFLFFSRHYSREKFSLLNMFKIGSILLLISFLCFTFFISYNLGVTAKLKTEISEKDFDKDKTLLNTLYPFLYNYTSYSSEKLFDYPNILYPKPYPITQEVVYTTYETHGEKEVAIENNYYSIDTLKILKSNYKKIGELADTIFSTIGFNKEELSNRIISKIVSKDSVKIIYKGEEVYPQYDDSICIFMQNKVLFNPIKNASVYKQQYQSAIKRYNLLYKYNKDSLLYKIEKLDSLLKKYNIESKIEPKELTTDIFYYRDNPEEPLNGIRNSYDRNSLIERFKGVNNLFYQPNYLHPLIQITFFYVVFVTWIILFLFFILLNFRNVNKRKE